MPTYSNGQYNPNPLANPFNTRIYGNYSLNSCSPLHVNKLFNPKNKNLPDPIQPEFEQNELHTPTQDIPFSLNDFQNIADQYSSNKTWNDSEIYSLDSNPNVLSKKDIEYWQNAEIKTNELSMNMSDEQKQMMNDLVNMFPKSKFEDENS